jgi:glucose/arabinose dehydrogenase
VKRALAPLLVVALSFGLTLMPGAAASADSSAAAGIGFQAVVTDLPFPAAFTFGPGGSIWFADRFSGAIRIYNPATHEIHTSFTVPNVVTSGEQGLLGLALHPEYPVHPFVYAYATRDVGGTLRNQILRIRTTKSIGVSWSVIFSSQTVAGAYHDGGRILFGPSGNLLAVVGEAHTSANAQNLSTAAGKIVRMTADGHPVPGNRLGGRIFVRGIRNSYGMAFDPDSNRLWETENGPECNDELNQFSDGDNGAWGPNENCNGVHPFDTNNSGPTPRTLPLRWFTPTIAITGAVFCPIIGCGLPGSQGHLFFGAYKTGEIRRATLSADRQHISSMTVVIGASVNHKILSMERGPDGHLYFSTSIGIFKLVAT